jgi:hypothetical protein
VLEDGAEPFKVVPAELNADAFRECVADRVRMAKALALNDLYSKRPRRGEASGMDDQIHPGLRPRLSRTAHGCPAERATTIVFHQSPVPRELKSDRFTERIVQIAPRTKTEVGTDTSSTVMPQMGSMAIFVPFWLVQRCHNCNPDSRAR